MGKLRKYCVVFLVFILWFSSLGGMQIQSSAQAMIPFDIEAESALLVDAETGKILFQKEADLSLPPASMSKMMTEYLVLEAIEEGQMDWNTVVRTSDYAHYLGALDGTSRVFLAAGEERTVRELYIAMAVYSGNDATVALAEQVAGSESMFVELMNQKAEELGMTNTHFVNTTGLPNSMLGDYIPAGSAEDENLMSARDTAILARTLVNKYPEVLSYSSIPEDKETFDIHMINFNWMLEGNPQIDAQPHTYQGLDGLKTGYTGLAGYCFTGTAQRDGMRLISVIMRSESKNSRFVETRKLLDYGFNNFVHQQMADEGTVLEDFKDIPVAKGKEKETSVALGDSIQTVIHKDEQDLYKLEHTTDPDVINEDGYMTAPITEGQVIGEVQLVYSGEIEYDFIQEDGSDIESVPLVSQEEIEKAGWLSLLMRSIGQFFGEIWSSIVGGIKSWFS